MTDPGCFLKVSDVTFISNPDPTSKAKVARMARVFCRLNCSYPTEPTSSRAVGVLKNDLGLKELADDSSALQHSSGVEGLLEVAVQVQPPVGRRAMCPTSRHQQIYPPMCIREHVETPVSHDGSGTLTYSGIKKSDCTRGCSNSI